MNAKYILEQRVLDPHLQLEIDEDRFKALDRARAVLSDARAFEQGYELLLNNFIQMELAFTEIGLRSTIEFDHRYPTLAETLREANRHVVNVLTAMKGYVDQIPQLFKILGWSPTFGEVAQDKVRDMHFTTSAYRFVCELRNHAQHQGTAVQGFEGSLVLRSDPNGWADSVTLYASKSALSAAGFKSKGLTDQPEKIDVRQRVRVSMVGLGGVHLELRELLKLEVDAARAAFDQAISDYRAAGAGSAIGLAARRVGKPAQDVPVLINWDDIRIELANKNSQPPRLWPKRSHREPDVATITALRASAGHTVAQAAAQVFVPEQRWADWEAGLPMPEGLFHLYQLQIDKHPTHKATPLAQPALEHHGAEVAAPDGAG